MVRVKLKPNWRSIVRGEIVVFALWRKTDDNKNGVLTICATDSPAVMLPTSLCNKLYDGGTKKFRKMIDRLYNISGALESPINTIEDDVSDNIDSGYYDYLQIIIDAIIETYKDSNTHLHMSDLIEIEHNGIGAVLTLKEFVKKFSGWSDSEYDKRVSSVQITGLY